MPSLIPFTFLNLIILMHSLQRRISDKNASFVEKKIQEVLSSGKKIKTVLMEEGLNKTQYQSWRNSVQRITGKKIKDFLKNDILIH